MKAFEFQAHVDAEGVLHVPTAIRNQMGPDQPVRVVLLVNETPPDWNWEKLTAEQFLQGYDASDAIYDNLPRR
jgi:hypothetical protein